MDLHRAFVLALELSRADILTIRKACACERLGAYKNQCDYQATRESLLSSGKAI